MCPCTVAGHYRLQEGMQRHGDAVWRMGGAWLSATPQGL
eukprot:gene6079-19645_t